MFSDASWERSPAKEATEAIALSVFLAVFGFLFDVSCRLSHSRFPNMHTQARRVAPLRLQKPEAPQAGADRRGHGIEGYIPYITHSAGVATPSLAQKMSCFGEKHGEAPADSNF